MRTVSIHQPNFFPWLGYFDKIARSDVFVFFDDVQYSKTGGTWSNRVKLLIAGEARWVTATVDRNYQGTRTIREMLFAHDNPWRSKMLRTLEGSYGRHPFYDECMAVVRPLIALEAENIAAFNIRAISAMCEALRLDTGKLVLSSALAHSGRSNELLCSITRAVGGQAYMYGGGADGYQDDRVYSEAGVALVPQAFIHPVYPQHQAKQFVSGLSLIDAVMNLGWTQTSGLLGRR